MLAPHSLQNFTPGAICAPQAGQGTRAMLAPQLLQNLPLPAGFPQTGHTVVLLSIFPFHTVAVSDYSSILRCMAEALALATYTSCRGAHSTQRPSSSL